MKKIGDAIEDAYWKMKSKYFSLLNDNEDIRDRLKCLRNHIEMQEAEIRVRENELKNLLSQLKHKKTILTDLQIEHWHNYNEVERLHNAIKALEDFI